MKPLKLESIMLIGAFSDGKHRLISVKDETGNAIKSLIVIMESEITVLETPIENIKLDRT